MCVNKLPKNVPHPPSLTPLVSPHPFHTMKNKHTPCRLSTCVLLFTVSVTWLDVEYDCYPAPYFLTCIVTHKQKKVCVCVAGVVHESHPLCCTTFKWMLKWAKKNESKVHVEVHFSILVVWKTIYKFVFLFRYVCLFFPTCLALLHLRSLRVFLWIQWKLSVLKPASVFRCKDLAWLSCM